MTIKSKSEFDDRAIDLTGPQGNAFCLMGLARSTAKQLSIDPQPILDDMMSSDYEHLVEVFDKHFGQIYTLYR
jgi:hypothetical protein